MEYVCRTGEGKCEHEHCNHIVAEGRPGPKVTYSHVCAGRCHQNDEWQGGLPQPAQKEEQHFHSMVVPHNDILRPLCWSDSLTARRARYWCSNASCANTMSTACTNRAAAKWFASLHHRGAKGEQHSITVRVCRWMVAPAGVAWPGVAGLTLSDGWCTYQ